MPATRGDRGAVAQLADVRHSLQKKSVGCTIGVGQARGQNRHGFPGIGCAGSHPRRVILSHAVNHAGLGFWAVNQAVPAAMLTVLPNNLSRTVHVLGYHPIRLPTEDVNMGLQVQIWARCAMVQKLRRVER